MLDTWVMAVATPHFQSRPHPQEPVQRLVSPYTYMIIACMHCRRCTEEHSVLVAERYHSKHLRSLFILWRRDAALPN